MAICCASSFRSASAKHFRWPLTKTTGGRQRDERFSLTTALPPLFKWRFNWDPLFLFLLSNRRDGINEPVRKPQHERCGALFSMLIASSISHLLHFRVCLCVWLCACVKHRVGSSRGDPKTTSSKKKTFDEPTLFYFFFFLLRSIKI